MIVSKYQFTHNTCSKQIQASIWMSMAIAGHAGSGIQASEIPIVSRGASLVFKTKRFINTKNENIHSPQPMTTLTMKGSLSLGSMWVSNFSHLLFLLFCQVEFCFHILARICRAWWGSESKLGVWSKRTAPHTGKRTRPQSLAWRYLDKPPQVQILFQQLKYGLGLVEGAVDQGSGKESFSGSAQH